MKPAEAVLHNDQEVLKYLRGRFPVFHLSNVFFRDIQFGIQSYLKGRDLKVNYRLAEEIARQFIAKLEREKIFRPIDRQTWMVNFEEFRKPLVKPAAPVAKAPSAVTAPAVTAS
jgi:hypothetical protein